MSVVFQSEANLNVAHILACVCGQVKTKSFPTYDDAYAEFKTGKYACTDTYCGYVVVTPAVEEPELQLSNSNALYLIDALNIYPDFPLEDKYCGSLPVDEFSALVENALSVLPYDTGLADLRVGRSFFGGREEGYLQVKLINLRNLVAWARENNRANIVWG